MKPMKCHIVKLSIIAEFYSIGRQDGFHPYFVISVLGFISTDILT